VDREGKFYALEVNTRIQWSTRSPEMISGFDIIRKCTRSRPGERLSLRQGDVLLRGHAIQCRSTRKTPRTIFAPSFGRIAFLRQISGPFVRTESGIYQGWEVPPFYDSLLSKICSVGKDRENGDPADAARAAGIRHLGVRTTIPLLRRIMDHPDFVAGRIDTGFIEETSPADRVRGFREEIFKVAQFVAEVSGLGRNVHSG